MTQEQKAITPARLGVIDHGPHAGLHLLPNDDRYYTFAVQSKPQFARPDESPSAFGPAMIAIKYAVKYRDEGGITWELWIESGLPDDGKWNNDCTRPVSWYYLERVS